MTKQLFSRTEVAKIFGVHPLTVRNWEKKNLIKPVGYVGLRPRYSLEDLTKMASDQPVVFSKTESLIDG